MGSPQPATSDRSQEASFLLETLQLPTQSLLQANTVEMARLPPHISDGHPLSKGSESLETIKHCPNTMNTMNEAQSTVPFHYRCGSITSDVHLSAAPPRTLGVPVPKRRYVDQRVENATNFQVPLKEIKVCVCVEEISM